MRDVEATALPRSLVPSELITAKTRAGVVAAAVVAWSGVLGALGAAEAVVTAPLTSAAAAAATATLFFVLIVNLLASAAGCRRTRQGTRAGRWLGGACVIRPERRRSAARGHTSVTRREACAL